MVVAAAEMETAGQQVITMGVPAAVAMVTAAGETVKAAWVMVKAVEATATVVGAMAMAVAEMAREKEEMVMVEAGMVKVGGVTVRAVVEMATAAQMRRHTLAAQSGSGSAPRLPGVPSPSGQRSCRHSSRRRDPPSSSRRSSRRTRMRLCPRHFRPRPRSCRGDSGRSRRRYGCTRPPGQSVTTPGSRPRARRSSDNCWRREYCSHPRQSRWMQERLSGTLS